jgi:hypothetical protein
MRRASLQEEEEEEEEEAGGAAVAAAARLQQARARGAAPGDWEGVEESDPDGMAQLLAEQRAFLTSQKAPAARLVRRSESDARGVLAMRWGWGGGGGLVIESLLGWMDG